MKLTLALFAYNQAPYVADAVSAILKQTVDSAEVILSDDASPDSTFEIIQAAVEDYDGPLTVRSRQNEENMGLTGHINAVMAEATGDLVLVFAGDDISMPDRAKISADHFTANPSLEALSLRYKTIDASGRITGEQAAVPPQRITIPDYFSGKARHPNGAGRAYRRSVFEAFGPLSADCPTEDTTLLFRAMLLGEVQEFEEFGLLYRKHGESLSSVASLRRMNLTAIRHQFLVDLEKAFSLHLIDQETKQRYSRLMDEYWARRRLVAAADERGLTSVLPSLLAEKDLTVTEKARFLKRRLRRIWARKG